MKILNKILLIAGLLAMFSLNARAQFDLFGAPRTIVAVPPQVLTSSSTNFVIDTHGFEGVAKVDIFITTNTVVTPVSVQLYSSPDRTNWTAVTYALGVSANVITTNLYYGSGTPLATNAYLLPGTVTTPTAASAGFATPYLAPAPFTSTAALSLTGAASIGYQVQDAGRYLQIGFTLTSSTNGVGAMFTGRKQQQ